MKSIRLLVIGAITLAVGAGHAGARLKPGDALPWLDVGLTAIGLYFSTRNPSGDDTRDARMPSGGDVIVPQPRP